MYRTIFCERFPTEVFRVRTTSSSGNNCMLHALVSAYDPEYNSFNPSEQDEYIDSIRELLCEKFTFEEYKNTSAYLFYLESKFSEISYTSLLSDLRNNKFLGEGLIDYISDTLNVDIYFMRKVSKTHMDVYGYPFSDNINHKDRFSVILLFDGSHYETVAVKRGSGFISMIPPDDILITNLKR